MISYKPFEKELHDRFDDNTKEIAVNFLQSTGEYVLETALENQPEAFHGYDFYIRNVTTGQNLNVEVERKSVWEVEGRWQYYGGGIHISGRKAKSRAHIFIMVNKSGRTLLFSSMRAVLESPKIEKNTWNRYTNTRTKKERFFELSLSHPSVGMYHYSEGLWRRVPETSFLT